MCVCASEWRKLNEIIYQNRNDDDVLSQCYRYKRLKDTKEKKEYFTTIQAEEDRLRKKKTNSRGK